MQIGVPAEVKKHEYRVGLMPDAVGEFVAQGHDVVVQSDAGAGVGASDNDYVQAGAKILPDATAVYSTSDLVIKVKEPQPVEWGLLREGQFLFTYLHLAPDPDQTKALLASGCIAIAYETVTAGDGSLPLLAPMSEIAGRLSIEAAGAAMRRSAGGSGLLLGGVPGVRPARVVVIGGGVVGTHAARMAAGLGADVIVMDRSLARLRALDELFEGRVRTLFSTRKALEQEIEQADVVIGAVLVPGARAPKLINRSQLKTMKKSAVLVDVAIDQGGCFETSRPTTHDEPTYVVDGVIHYCVANMPGAVPRTSSQALNNATLPFGLALARFGENALKSNPHLLAGLNVYRHRVTNRAVAESVGEPFVPPLEAIAR